MHPRTHIHTEPTDGIDMIMLMSILRSMLITIILRILFVIVAVEELREEILTMDDDLTDF